MITPSARTVHFRPLVASEAPSARPDPVKPPERAKAGSNGQISPKTKEPESIESDSGSFPGPERAVICELLALAELLESSGKPAIRDVSANVVLPRLNAIVNEHSAVRSWDDAETMTALQRVFKARAQAPDPNIIEALNSLGVQTKVLVDKVKGIVSSSSRHGDLQVIRSSAKLLIDAADALIDHEESR